MKDSVPVPNRSPSAIAEVIERSDTVGFGPDADFSGILERLIVPLESCLAIEDHSEMAALKRHAQTVPLVGGDLHVGSLLLGAPAVDGVIDRHVVFQGIRPRDVVIVRVLCPPD